MTRVRTKTKRKANEAWAAYRLDGRSNKIENVGGQLTIFNSLALAKEWSNYRVGLYGIKKVKIL